MAESNLARTGLDRQIEPQVVSQSNPSPQDLLEVRADVQSSPRLQNLFRTAHDEKWTAERLTDGLVTELSRDRLNGATHLEEAARFLVDEYQQIGPTGIQLINTETGRIAALIREEDLYQPAPVPRDGSTTLATPLPRIRPDVETAIVTWFHDKGREANIVAALAARGHQTELLKEMGDPRLLVATRRGRKHIVESLARIEPKRLLEAAGGRAGTFLRLFVLTEEPVGELATEGLVHLSGEVSAKSVMGVQDPTTTNLHHNRPAILRAALVGGWIRHLALTLSLRAHHDRDVEKGTIDFGQGNPHIPPNHFWVTPPDAVRPFYERAPRVEVLPVEGARPLALPVEGQLGVIRIPREFEASSHDLFDRWEASAYLHFDMWVDLRRVKAFEFLGIEEVAQVL